MVQGDNDNTHLGYVKRGPARGALGIDGIIFWVAAAVLGPLACWWILSTAINLGSAGINWTSAKLSEYARQPQIGQYLH